MRTSPFAKALTKHTYSMGAPIRIVCIGYVIGLVVWLATGWLWYLLPLGLVWHLFVKAKYEKDEYWILYFIDAMKEKVHLEP